MPADAETARKVFRLIDALEDIKGHDIVVYNTSAMPSMFERVVIASGDSNRQVKALADNVCEKLRALGAKIYGTEGEASGAPIGPAELIARLTASDAAVGSGMDQGEAGQAILTRLRLSHAVSIEALVEAGKAFESLIDLGDLQEQRTVPGLDR